MMLDSRRPAFLNLFFDCNPNSPPRATSAKHALKKLTKINTDNINTDKISKQSMRIFIKLVS